MAEETVRTTPLDVPPPDRRWLEWLQALGPVVVLVAIGLVTQDRPRSGGLEATIVLVVLPLVVRRVFPLAVLVTVAVGSLLTAAGSPAPWIQVCAVGLASYTFGGRAESRTASGLAVIAVAAGMAVGFMAQDASAMLGLVLPFVVVVPTWLIGDLVRSRRIESERRAEATERSLREREEHLRVAAAEERRHVARELHDVVAHAVSVMVIQAGAARQVVRTSPDQAEASLLAVESTGRQAMTELRRFLGALSDEDEAAGLAPQPGMSELASLVSRVRAAGLPASSRSMVCRARCPPRST